MIDVALERDTVDVSMGTGIATVGLGRARGGAEYAGGGPVGTGGGGVFGLRIVPLREGEGVPTEIVARRSDLFFELVGNVDILLDVDSSVVFSRSS